MIPRGLPPTGLSVHHPRDIPGNPVPIPVPVISLCSITGSGDCRRAPICAA